MDCNNYVVASVNTKFLKRLDGRKIHFCTNFSYFTTLSGFSGDFFVMFVYYVSWTLVIDKEYNYE